MKTDLNRVCLYTVATKSLSLWLITADISHVCLTDRDLILVTSFLFCVQKCNSPMNISFLKENTVYNKGIYNTVFPFKTVVSVLRYRLSWLNLLHLVIHIFDILS